MERCYSCGHDISKCPSCGRSQKQGEDKEPLGALTSPKNPGYRRKQVEEVVPVNPVRRGR